MDTITLVRKVKDEYMPRVYTLSGTEFDTLLAAVKALPQRKYESTFGFNHWVVNGEGIKLLQEQGYTISQESDLFVYQEHTSYGEDAQPYQIEVSISNRRQSGEPPAVNVSGLQATILLYVSDEFIELRKAEIDVARKESGSKYAADAKDVIEIGKREAVRLYYEKLREIFESVFQPTRKRTIDDLKAAIAAIKLFAVSNSVYKPEKFLAFVGLVLDGKATIMEHDHEKAQRVIQEAHAAKEAAAVAMAAAKEAQNADMLANAPQKIEEWFNRLTKAEIAEALEKYAQVTLNEKQLKQTKRLIIESITGDRELCEKLVSAAYLSY